MSPNVAAVMEPLTAAICIYQAGSIVESSLGRMDNLIDKIVEVTLQHRLCMFPTLMIVVVWLISHQVQNDNYILSGGNDKKISELAVPKDALLEVLNEVSSR